MKFVAELHYMKKIVTNVLWIPLTPCFPVYLQITLTVSLGNLRRIYICSCFSHLETFLYKLLSL